MTKKYECAIRSDVAYPDDINQWPDDFQKLAYRAADNLLKQHPGAAVTDRKSYCIGRDHPRYPDDNDPRNFCLVYQITISDAAIEAA